MNQKDADPVYAVSACLCGKPCRYDGGSKPDRSVSAFAKKHNSLLICPESMVLPCPRPPAEILPDSRVIDREGRDLTAAFQEGARRALALCRRHGVTHAILKERSPSCGVRQVYDGNFSGVCVDGMGITARLFAENGIRVISEEDFHAGRIF